MRAGGPMHVLTVIALRSVGEADLLQQALLSLL